MEVLNVVPGSGEWKALRLDCFTASEAPVMMGCSPNMSRDDLLTYKTTKEEAVISRFQQIIFDKGHDTEAKAREILEGDKWIGEELYPVVLEEYVAGMRMLASLDGQTMLADFAFEHKQWNAEKAKKIEDTGELEPVHYWQLEQQLLVSDMDYILFVMSDGTTDNWVELEYRSRPKRRKDLIAGWKQFAIDFQGYEPKIYTEKPEAAPVMDLPAINFKLNGLAVQSNIDAYKEAATKLVEDSKKPMETDQDFADRELMVKKFFEAESKIKLVQDQIVGEIVDVDTFCKDLGFIGDMIRSARLNSQKLIKTQKDTIREGIVKRASNEFAQFVAEIEGSLGEYSECLQAAWPDIRSAIKGKRTIKSLNEAANDAVASAKLMATAEKDKVDKLIAEYKKIVGDYRFLFPDLSSLVRADKEFFISKVMSRINDHKAKEAEAEAKKKRELLEREARIKKEAEEAAIAAERRAVATKAEEERRKAQAEENAAHEAQEKINAAKRRAAEAELKAKQAAEAERQRIADKEALMRREAEQRAANEQHRALIFDGAYHDLKEIVDKDAAMKVAVAIRDGLVSNVTINY